MKMTKQEMVLKFQETFGHKNRKHYPTNPNETIRVELIQEELDELKEALELKDPVETLDAIIDLLFLVYGAAAEFGFSEEVVDLAFEEVYESNMSKLGEDGQPIYREDGKVLKGPNFRKPNLAQFIKDQE
jgi:predicted HAD superfamily Cof-like phosphohydrolase